MLQSSRERNVLIDRCCVETTPVTSLMPCRSCLCTYPAAAASWSIHRKESKTEIVRMMMTSCSELGNFSKVVKKNCAAQDFGTSRHLQEFNLSRIVRDYFTLDINYTV